MQTEDTIHIESSFNEVAAMSDNSKVVETVVQRKVTLAIHSYILTTMNRLNNWLMCSSVEELADPFTG